MPDLGGVATDQSGVAAPSTQHPAPSAQRPAPRSVRRTIDDRNYGEVFVNVNGASHPPPPSPASPVPSISTTPRHQSSIPFGLGPDRSPSCFRPSRPLDTSPVRTHPYTLTHTHTHHTKVPISQLARADLAIHLCRTRVHANQASA